MKTFYAIHWWLKDNSDFREIDQIPTLKQALQKASVLFITGKDYHSFTIYAYHAELIDRDFIESDKLYRRQQWQRIDDDFEKCWDINGRPI